MEDQTLQQQFEDLEMTDAPFLVSPSKEATLLPTKSIMTTCTVPHSHTGGRCPTNWQASLGSLENLRHRLRLIHQDEEQTSYRCKAFDIIKQMTKSKFGNSSSPLAQSSNVGESEGKTRGGRGSGETTYLNSWMLAPVWDQLRDQSLIGFSCKRDPMTGTPVLIYTHDRPQ
ncbi:hypothetical protein BDU57DRAFT_570015 [Ampelomyces quisqualis]|uniref:Uncharacterized protein n=1 Tax=Ampelomyces quisqualis TaxID=50730 RepID=A0A6A5QX75_AMPQU|nr:hypothetical protein BDU57DRAFT_570015 [Ampelomyces quisqualis]